MPVNNIAFFIKPTRLTNRSLHNGRHQDAPKQKRGQSYIFFLTYTRISP